MRPNIQLILLAAALATASICAYAKKYPLTASTTVPAARGEVDVGTDKNGNTEVKLEVEHLAQPGNLSPPKTVYIVWFQERGSDPRIQGVLRMNKNLKGTFKTTTPMKSFDIVVTAESDPTLKAPEGQEVLRSSIQP